jgi:predicted transglutaminase-like cysteine proteinase
LVLPLALACAPSAHAQYRDLSERALDRVEEQHGTEAKQRVSQWRTLLRRQGLTQSFTDSEQLSQANDFFNLVEWVSDLEHWGREDYWATPIETLATNGGDCEDFSIGKYFSLKEVGVRSDRLRISYVKSLEYNQAHMVLAYYSSPGAEPLILDNINKTILPASQRPDLLPIYSFNGDSLWLAKSRGKKISTKNGLALPQWQGLAERMEQETQ